MIRVVAYSSLTGRPLTGELTREVLDGLYPRHRTARPQRPTIDPRDPEAACAQFGLTAEELLSTSRAARVSWPRQVAMYLARELTGESLPAIGRQFGGRDHTTVLHACRRTSKRIAADVHTRTLVENLLATLQSVPSTHSLSEHDRSA